MKKELADKIREHIFKRTGLDEHSLSCPREKSNITPCVARDGESAVAEGTVTDNGFVCVGCLHRLNDLWEKELSYDSEFI